MPLLKKTFKKLTPFLLSFVLAIGLSLSLQSLLAAWAPPTAAPPFDNAPAPITVGTSGSAQIINGGLGVMENFLVGTNAFFVNQSTGRVGIGTTNPLYPLDVNGVIKTVNRVEYENGGADWQVGLATDGSRGFTFLANHLVSNKEKLRITDSGNVGIGTTNPGKTLDVNGTIRGKLDLEVYNTLRLYDTNGFSNYSSVFTESDGTNGTRLKMSTKVDGGALTEKVTILNNGNVGIGTTGPGYPLDIRNVNNSGTAELRLNNDNSTKLWTGTALSRQSSEKWFIGMNDTNDSLRFRKNGSSDDLVIDSSGNVGIGTTNPGKTLDVNGTIRGKLDLEVYNTLRLYDTNGFSNYSSVFTESDGTNGTRLKMSTKVDGGALTEKVTILNNGNVGIGTTDPKAELHVSGSVFPIVKIGGGGNGGLAFGDEIISDEYVGMWRGGANSINTADVTLNRNYLNIQAAEDIVFMASNHQFGSATERMRITSGGRVGIGTTPTSPVNNLDVRGNVSIGSGLKDTDMPFGLDANGRYLMISGASGNPSYGVLALANNAAEGSDVHLGGILFAQTTTDKTGSNAGLKALIGGYTSGSGGSVGGYGGYLKFFTKPDNGGLDIAQYERMRIDMNGNVGIGTAGPEKLLHLYKKSDSENAEININSKYANDTGPSKWSIYQEKSDGNLRFWNNAVSGEKNVLSIGDDGNVGIGTTEPGAKLEVNGTMKILGPHNSTSFVKDVNYLADTDGIVTAYSREGTGGWRTLWGYTDATATPIFKIAADSGNGINGIDYCTVTFPVRKGNYWRIGGLGDVGVVTITWTPFGT